MPGRGIPTGRKRKASSTLSEPTEATHSATAENLAILESPAKWNKDEKIIDFQQIISESLELPIHTTENSATAFSNFAVNGPEIIGCSRDKLGVLVPEQLKTKIKQN